MNIQQITMKQIFFVLLILLLNGKCFLSNAQPLQQKKQFSRQDSLRGTLNAERDWWDVDSYSIEVTPDYKNRTIEGSTEITFKIVKPFRVMQIDLQEPMEINSVKWKNKNLTYKREGNVYHVYFPKIFKNGSIESIAIQFSGHPRVAVNPPWDGGWIFEKDKQGRPWMSVACQGLGASVWYPCKDHQSDEPNHGASVAITVPDTLIAVANGRLLSKKNNNNGTMTYQWTVVNPINNYNIVPYIGKYVHWDELYSGEKGNLTCDYWVLDYELKKAKEQFKQVAKMLKSFEYWFGPYPFYEDGYKLVQSPHLGMEHQSAVAYGNRFQNGYLGRDLSGTGWGKKWDFIIVHESGHEWFANNITTNDIADMWVHEGFTNYSETLFTTSEYGVEAGNDYVIGTRKLIENEIPIIGPYGVNQVGSGDMYYKGGNLLHTIRAIINDDEKFRQILRGINKVFYHKTVNSKEVEAYISEQSGINFSVVFDQFLRDIRIPILEYKLNDHTLSYRFTNCNKNFTMPLKIKLGKELWITPTTDWKKELSSSDSTEKTFEVNRNFYIQTMNVE